MTSVIKRYLFVGISLALAALTARHFIQELEIEGSLDQPAAPPPPPPQIDQTEKAEPLRAEASRPLHKAPAPKPFVAPTVTFSGKVVRNGPSFALRETAGILYPLDVAGRVGRYEGEDVRVTGKLDLDTRLLYVDAIESNVA